MFCQNNSFGVTFLVTYLGFKFLYWVLLNVGKYSSKSLCYGVDLCFC